MGRIQESPFAPDARVAVIVTCEHASPVIPEEWARHFERAGHVLESHRGWDIGAPGVAVALATRIAAADIFLGTQSRLLVDLNRSETHREVFSQFMAGVDDDDRERILREYHRPYRDDVRRCIRDRLQYHDAVLHIGVHSFTDVLDGHRRQVDIGLLFDPDRTLETDLAATWRLALETVAPHLRTRFNEPYLGVDDGLTTTLRAEFPPERYAGIEIEIRQGLLPDAAAREEITALLAPAVTSALSRSEA